MVSFGLVEEKHQLRLTTFFSSGGSIVEIVDLFVFLPICTRYFSWLLFQHEGGKERDPETGSAIRGFEVSVQMPSKFCTS